MRAQIHTPPISQLYNELDALRDELVVARQQAQYWKDAYFKLSSDALEESQRTVGMALSAMLRQAERKPTP